MENREEMIRERIKEQDFIEAMQLEGVRQSIWEKLIGEKGFDPKDIEIDPEFNLGLSNCEARVKIDFIVNLSSVSFMVIRCIPTAIESWERYVISFARSVKDDQIPYAVVTDGENARIFDVLAGSLIGESLKSLFSRAEAEKIMNNFKKVPCPGKRLEKEKRIVYAFEGIKCPSVKEEK